jgi:predicted phage-related endonuclease
LNLYWFEQRTGRLVTHAGESCQHTAHSFMACTLDGMTKTEAGREAVFEAKHVNQFSKMPDVIAKYTPQLHHNMAVVGAAAAILSVFIGTMNYEWAEIERDEWYLAELIDREKEFWAAVESKTQPLGMDPVAAPVAPEEWRTEDLTGNNEWGAAAAGWLENRDAAKSFAAAEKAVKGLVPADVGLAHGHGVQCKRSKNNSLRVTEEK